MNRAQLALPAEINRLQSQRGVIQFSEYTSERRSVKTHLNLPNTFLKKHTMNLNPLPHLKRCVIKKIAKKNDLSPRLIMRLRGTFISIVSVCSPTHFDVYTPPRIEDSLDSQPSVNVREKSIATRCRRRHAQRSPWIY
ncbi:hypothetical protein F2P81_007834 [Scophthalmus maximus]|uniref:Uncharacterized protein n=1 Tax=Scophthalmus maximus TaxID=52904 RepID=A0A6A4T3Y5_SCOMX|nr:hypothetical protein F2P81_007834 [Scophthalmus maximus]